MSFRKFRRTFAVGKPLFMMEIVVLQSLFEFLLTPSTTRVVPSLNDLFCVRKEVDIVTD